MKNQQIEETEYQLAPDFFLFFLEFEVSKNTLKDFRRKIQRIITRVPESEKVWLARVKKAHDDAVRTFQKRLEGNTVSLLIL